MTTDGSEFPVRGVVGVVGGSEDEVRRQRQRLEELPGIGGVEVRADLFASCDAALHTLEDLADRWPILFTARLEAEGGAYRESEAERIKLYEQALQRGAVLIDVELRSEAARVLAQRGTSATLMPARIAWAATSSRSGVACASAARSGPVSPPAT